MSGRIVRATLSTNLPHAVAFAILAIVPLAVGILLVVVHQVNYRDASAARNWAPAPCVIEKNALSGEAGPGSLTLEYRYHFEGHEYLGVRPDLQMRSTTSHPDAYWDRKFIKRYPAGTRATCYVDPTNPADSVLDRDIAWQHARNLLRVAYPFLCVGVGFSLGFLRCFAGDPQPIGQGSVETQTAGCGKSKRNKAGKSAARQNRPPDIVQEVAAKRALAPPGPPPRKLGWLNSAAVLSGPANLQLVWLFVIGFSYLFFAFFDGPAAFAELLNLHRDTETTTGRVTDVRSLNQKELDELVYEYEFSFEVKGITHAAKSFTRGRHYKAGDSVSVEYDRADPASAGISGARRQNLPWWYSAVPLGVLVLLAPGLVGMYWHSYRTLRALQSGVVGKAARKQPAGEFDGAADFMTAVAALSPHEFHAGGRNYRARHFNPYSGTQDPIDVIVLYDPMMPERNVILDEHLSGLVASGPPPSVFSRVLDCVNAPLAIIALILLALI
jgi:hypothetical protein